jgi:hypothetical protein
LMQSHRLIDGTGGGQRPMPAFARARQQSGAKVEPSRLMLILSADR